MKAFGLLPWLRQMLSRKTELRLWTHSSVCTKPIEKETAMLRLEFKLNSTTLRIHDGRELNYSIKATCIVRNEINGLRKADQVVTSMPDQQPVFPRMFPVGTWSVGKPEARHQPDRRPFFIPTDASQELPVWVLKDGKYDRLSGAIVTDRGYGLHCSVYSTTLGCIRIHNEDDLLRLVELINTTLDAKQKVELVVS
jgi:hypothetical protein